MAPCGQLAIGNKIIQEPLIESWPLVGRHHVQFCHRILNDPKRMDKPATIRIKLVVDGCGRIGEVFHGTINGHQTQTTATGPGGAGRGHGAPQATEHSGHRPCPPLESADTEGPLAVGSRSGGAGQISRRPRARWRITGSIDSWASRCIAMSPRRGRSCCVGGRVGPGRPGAGAQR